MTVAPNSDSRGRILSTIQAAEHALTVDDVAAITGLHPNTIRTHLDVLLASGLVARDMAATGGRGRPRWKYRASQAAPSPYKALVEALTLELVQSRDPAMADAAAGRWAEALPEPRAASTPDEAVEQATHAMNALGFTATASLAGDAISLTGCPYADLVDETPMICDIHAALISRLLRESGQPVTVESVDVWVSPEMCVARLGRPDRIPSRSISLSSEGTATIRGIAP